MEEDCISHADISPRLSYCKSFVTWPVTVATNASLEAAQAEAFKLYTDLRLQYQSQQANPGNVTGKVITPACLSYQARYACVTKVPKCVEGRAVSTCQQVCEEYTRRCIDAGNLDACEPLPDEQCSRALPSVAVSWRVLAATVLLLVLALSSRQQGAVMF